MAIVVKQNEEPIPAEVLATAITKLSKGLEDWRGAGMKRYALIVLLTASTRVCKRDVEAVLNGIDGLKGTYCLPKAVPTVASKPEGK